MNQTKAAFLARARARARARACACACVLAWGGISGCATKPPRQPPQQEQLTKALTPPPRLEPKEPLPPAVREILKNRMANHAREMGDLMSAIMILDYPVIHAGARSIAGNANLSRPLTADATELNAQLPEKFFEHQDDLRKHAGALAIAAEHVSPFEVADAYGRLSEACVRCHAVYRAGR